MNQVQISNPSKGYWGLAILIAGLYAILSFITPYYLDDWMFIAGWRDDMEGGYTFSWNTWRRFYNFIRGYDNGRIANALSPISTMFSPWKEIFPILTGILLAFIVISVQRIATGRRNTGYLALVWFFMILALPWRDSLFVRDYSLNYIWGSAVTFAFLYLLRKACSREVNSPWLTAAAVIMAILAGGWHESFAAATLCGLGLLVIVRRGKLPFLFYFILCVYLISTLAFMLSPGMIGRIHSSLGGPHRRPIVKSFIIIGVAAISVVGCLFSGKGRKIIAETFSRDSAIVAVGIIISGFIIAVATANTKRSYFWPDLASVCLITRMLMLSISKLRLSRMTLRIATAILTLICTAQTIGVIIWQNRYTGEYRKIMALLDDSPSGTVYYDFSWPMNAPSYTLGIPIDNEIWMSPWNIGAMQAYYMLPALGIVPTELEFATPSEATPLWGEKTTGTYKYKVPEYIDGGRIAVPFITERGDTLTYIFAQL